MEVKAYTSCDVVNTLPEVGDEYCGYIVKSVSKVGLDWEQGDPEVYNYDYYCIHAEDEDGYSVDDYVAIEMKDWLLTCSKDGIDIDYEEVIRSHEEPSFWVCYTIAAENGCEHFTISEC